MLLVLGLENSDPLGPTNPGAPLGEEGAGLMLDRGVAVPPPVLGIPPGPTNPGAPLGPGAAGFAVDGEDGLS